jgi:transcriptional regulator with XRE-family HTH domain
MSVCTGIPASTLSKVEHDRLSLTYDKLLLLTQRLDIRIEELFSDRARHVDGAVTARRSIGILDSAKCVKTKHQDLYYFCSELRAKRMTPVLMKIRSLGPQESSYLVRHEGEEYVYVLEGSIRVITEFYDPVLLIPGESIYLDGSMAHAYVTAQGWDEATVLALSSRAEEGPVSSFL